jgi:hypothetical protein
VTQLGSQNVKKIVGLIIFYIQVSLPILNNHGHLDVSVGSGLNKILHTLGQTPTLAFVSSRAPIG